MFNTTLTQILFVGIMFWVRKLWCVESIYMLRWSWFLVTWSIVIGLFFRVWRDWKDQYTSPWIGLDWLWYVFWFSIFFPVKCLGLVIPSTMADPCINQVIWSARATHHERETKKQYIYIYTHTLLVFS